MRLAIVMILLPPSILGYGLITAGSVSGDQVNQARSTFYGYQVGHLTSGVNLRARLATCNA
jgi:hypothetical protein